MTVGEAIAIIGDMRQQLSQSSSSFFLVVSSLIGQNGLVFLEILPEVFFTFSAKLEWMNDEVLPWSGVSFKADLSLDITGDIGSFY